MNPGVQLSLDSFDPAAGPLCRKDPRKNGFLELCIRCPHASRKGGTVRCLLFLRIITSRSKYSLNGWRLHRNKILVRDRNACVACGQTTGLCIHHIDSDRTNDNPSNLVTLCGACHGRVHAGADMGMRAPLIGS